MRRRWTRQDLEGATLWWVASLTLQGRTYRWAESPLSIASDTGTLAIAGGLEGAQLAQRAPWMGRDPEQRSATLTVATAAVGLDVASALAGGAVLDGAPVEVALWRAGDPWEDRQVILQGQVTSYEWGGREESLLLDVEEAAYLDRGLMPPPGAVVSATTWPNAADSAVGMAYPTILGAPGSSGVPAAPALMVASSDVGGASNWLLVAGHPVSATSVLVSDGAATEALAVFQAADGAGRIVSLVDLAAATSIAVDPAATYQVGWNAGPGLLSITGALPATGAGSILEAVLAQSTLPIDRGALASARNALDSYLIGAFVQQQLSPMEWVTRALLPLLPVAVLTGPFGWRVLPIPVAPSRSDCSATLQAGDGFTQVVRLGRAKRVGLQEVANHLELKYALGTETNAATATAILSGAGYDGVAHTDLQSRISDAAYGRRVRSQDTVVIYDAGTAYRVLRWQSSAYAFSRTEVRYSCHQEYAFLAAGDLIWVEDTRLQVAQPAWVQEVLLTVDGRVEVELVLWRIP